MNVLKKVTPLLLVTLSAIIMITTSCKHKDAKPADAGNNQVKPIEPQGYRPGSDSAGQFLESIGTTTFTVLPTAIWSTEETIFLPASQQQIVQFIEKNDLGGTSTTDFEIYKSAFENKNQMGIFQSTLKQVGKQALATENGGDYFLFLELMEFKPGSDKIGIGGIQCYVVDKNGKDAFSFLLNSHHTTFNNAKLITQDTSLKGRAQLVQASTDLALSALKSNIDSGG